jgi:uncharacterized protein (TIGR02598 family)
MQIPAFCRSRKSCGNSRAFVLIEIVLALGIFAFAVVAILGLLSVCLSSEKSSSADTALSFATQTAVTTVHNQGFEAVSTNTAYAGTSPIFYFDAGGAISLDSTGALASTPQTDSIYSCTVTRKVASNSTNLLLLQFKFNWPIVAAPAQQQGRIVNASLANYE